MALESIDTVLAKKDSFSLSAFYNGSFGIYPQNVADYFEMTHITPLN